MWPVTIVLKWRGWTKQETFQLIENWREESIQAQLAWKVVNGIGVQDR